MQPEAAVFERTGRERSKFHVELMNEIESMERRILDGKFPTYEIYQRQCGLVEGLRRALDLFEQLTEVEDLAE